jgi:DNA-binding Xre family transcriptional regulator
VAETALRIGDLPPPQGDTNSINPTLYSDQMSRGGRVVPEEHPSGPLEQVIAMRVREFRLAKGVSMTDVARRTGMSKAMVSKIENAQTSCSLSSLAKLADALEVPVTALFRGVDAEREAVFTAAGHGAQIARRGSNIGHLYQLLGALRGEHKRMEPLLVTLTEASEVFPLFQHRGTEFIHILEGVMVYGHGEARYEMHHGDSLVFDGEGPHGPLELIELPIRFLSVIAYGNLP